MLSEKSSSSVGVALAVAVGSDVTVMRALVSFAPPGPEELGSKLHTYLAVGDGRATTPTRYCFSPCATYPVNPLATTWLCGDQDGGRRRALSCRLQSNERFRLRLVSPARSN